MRGLVNEGSNHSSKSEKTFVDHASFLSTSSFRRHPAFTYIFGSSKIDQVELAYLEEIFAFDIALLGMNSDGENAMGTTRFLVEIRLRSPALRPAFLQNIEN